MARLSLAEIRGDMAASEAPDVMHARGRVDVAKLDALTEDDIARFNLADGFDPNDTLKGLRRTYTPAEIRAKAGLTQVEMAARLTVPLKTWRNWEQGRVTLEPTVRALLALVADDHERAFRVLDGGAHAPVPKPDLEQVAQGLVALVEELEEAGRTAGTMPSTSSAESRKAG